MGILKQSKYKVHEAVRKIYEQDISALRLWWNGMDDDWHRAMKGQINCKAEPTDEQLNQMAQLREFSLEHFDTNDLSPITMMPNLEKLDLSNTSIDDFTPLANCKRLKELDITLTTATDFTPIENLDLGVLRCKRVRVPYDKIREYSKKHPSCKIYWDLEGDTHWLDVVDGMDTANHSPIK